MFIVDALPFPFSFEPATTALIVIHTREDHRPDLSDCPPAKRLRGAPSLRIGDAGAMGRILVDGEPGITWLQDAKYARTAKQRCTTATLRRCRKLAGERCRVELQDPDP